MRKFRLEIEIENAAFDSESGGWRVEVGYILDGIRTKSLDFQDTEGKLRDHNDNTVGKWEVVDSDEVQR